MCPRQILRHGRWHPGLVEQGSDGICARLRQVLKFPQDDLTITEMMDDAGRYAVQTDKAESTHDLLHWEQTRKSFLVSQPVLERQHDGFGTDQRRQ